MNRFNTMQTAPQRMSEVHGPYDLKFKNHYGMTSPLVIKHRNSSQDVVSPTLNTYKYLLKLLDGRYVCL